LETAGTAGGVGAGAVNAGEVVAEGVGLVPVALKPGLTGDGAGLDVTGVVALPGEQPRARSDTSVKKALK